MSLAYRASTSANPDPMISLTFVEANYEVLESLLRERRRHMHNEELRTELDYFSEEYDEERKIEPKAERVRETTPVLHTHSLRVWRQRKSVVEFEDATNRDGGRVRKEIPKGGNPTFKGTSAYHPYRGYALQAPTSNNNLTSNGFMYSSAAPLNNYPFYTQPMYPLPNTPLIQTMGLQLFTDYTGW
ncbi:hypothetical protein Tco_0039102 [Tanacetum coccineum]